MNCVKFFLKLDSIKYKTCELMMNKPTPSEFGAHWSRLEILVIKLLFALFINKPMSNTIFCSTRKLGSILFLLKDISSTRLVDSLNNTLKLYQ